MNRRVAIYHILYKHFKVIIMSPHQRCHTGTHTLVITFGYKNFRVKLIHPHGMFRKH